MCGRTSLFALPEVIEGRFDVAVTDDIPPRYNVGPRDWLASVTNDEPEVLSQLEWGFVPHWADDPTAGPRPINARRERLDEAARILDAAVEKYPRDAELHNHLGLVAWEQG
ncbi:MAG: SOS response-associated peptidase family protein, partial [Halobacteriota archaeon]